MFTQVNHYEHMGKIYEQYHGNSFDRGASDNHYRRPRRPHKGGVGGGSGGRTTDLTIEEIAAYHAGYDWNEMNGEKKDYD